MRERLQEKIFPALGTINTISLYGEYDDALLERVKTRILALHQLFSIFSPDSDVSRINHYAGVCPVRVSEDTFYVLEQAERYRALTQGAFDITTGAATRVWREALKKKSLPKEADLAQASTLCAASSLVLNQEEHTAYLEKKGAQIDLGGIAKGYAADEAARILKNAGVQKALINLGGTVVSIGAARSIHIQYPFVETGKPMAAITIKDQAVVTSGSYKQCFFVQGQRYHHIINPRTLRPSTSGLVSVTLVGESAMDLDALATGVHVLGIERAWPILEARNIDAIFVLDNGKVQITPRLGRSFAMCG